MALNNTGQRFISFWPWSFNYLIDNSGINAQAKQTYIVCNYKQQQERTTRTTNVFNMRTFKFGSDIKYMYSGKFLIRY